MAVGRFWVVSVCLLLMVSVWYAIEQFGNEPDNDAEQAVQRQDETSPSAGSVVVQADYQPRSGLAEVSVPASSGDAANSLMERLIEASDYRVLVESLLANPTEKTGAYVSNLLKRCALMRAVDFSRYPASNSTRQDQARERYQARCSSFTDEELSPARLQAILHDPRFQGAFSALNKAVFLGDQVPGKRREEVVAAALQSGDPLLIERLSTYFTIRRPDAMTAGQRHDATGALTNRGGLLKPGEANGSASLAGSRTSPDFSGVYGTPGHGVDADTAEVLSLLFGQSRYAVSVNGHVYDDPYASEIVSSAWMSATCAATSTSCGEGDEIVQNLCAFEGNCQRSRDEAFREAIQAEAGAAGLALYDMLYPQFVDAIRHADISIMDGLKERSVAVETAR